MVKGSEIGKDVDDEGNMTMSDSVVIEASSGKKIGKTWKRKEIKVSKQKGELLNQVGHKRNLREVNVIGLDEMEMEEIRTFKKWVLMFRVIWREGYCYMLNKWRAPLIGLSVFNDVHLILELQRDALR